MDRLTDETDAHDIGCHATGYEDIIASLHDYELEHIYMRLAAYEDTGLAPDEVEALKTERVALWQEVGYTDGDHADAARFFHELEGTVNRLTDDLATAKAERDRFKARAEALESEVLARGCITCKHRGTRSLTMPCARCNMASEWEWRGPQEGAAE